MPKRIILYRGVIKVFCTHLDRLFPHWCTTQSHSTSPVVPTDLLSSASFFNLSCSSSDHGPWLPPIAPVVVEIIAVGVETTEDVVAAACDGVEVEEIGGACVVV
jgi:hypothetical protein